MDIFYLRKKWHLLLLLVFVIFFSALEANGQLPRKQLPPRGSSGSGELPPLNQSSSQSSSHAADDIINGPGMQKLTNAVGDAARLGMDIAVDAMKEWGEDCKRLDISAAYDAHIEGPSIGLQFRTPIVLGIFARVGFNTHYDEWKYNLKKIRWTAGLQLWVKNWNLEMGVGETYYKKLGDTSYGLTMATGYSQKIYKGLGAEASLGCALSFNTDGNDGNPYIKFIWRAGLVYRFCFN